LSARPPEGDAVGETERAAPIDAYLEAEDECGAGLKGAAVVVVVVVVLVLGSLGAAAVAATTAVVVVKPSITFGPSRMLNIRVLTKIIIICILLSFICIKYARKIFCIIIR
jgi:hypothetical protein